MTLYPRESHNDSTKAMAHRILDDARAGLDISIERINWALRVTGDLT